MKILTILFSIIAIATVFMIFKLAQATNEFEDSVQAYCELSGGTWTRYTPLDLFINRAGCSFED